MKLLPKLLAATSSTAADIARLAAEARPLVRSHGRWVELDAVDLKEAAAALAERADKTKMTGAEILRHSVGLEGNHRTHLSPAAPGRSTRLRSRSPGRAGPRSGHARDCVAAGAAGGRCVAGA